MTDQLTNFRDRTPRSDRGTIQLLTASWISSLNELVILITDQPAMGLRGGLWSVLLMCNV
jgi:hypothetical protein